MKKLLFRAILCLFFLSHSTVTPANLPLSGADGWQLSEASFASNPNGGSPAILHPSRLIDESESISGPQPVPLLYPSGLEKKRILSTPVIPTYSPRHSFVQDRSTGGFTLPSAVLQLQAPARLKTFQGPVQRRFFPPDSIIAAGPTRVVVAVNSSVLFYMKSGSQTFSAGLNKFFSALSENNGTRLFDPKVLFDQYAQRFILVVAAIRERDSSSWLFLAVSKTSDPHKAWALWALDMTLDGTTKTSHWADFPGLGIDEKAIYLTANMFRFGIDRFAYAKLRILDKSEVSKFGKIGYFDFFKMKDVTGELTGTLQPAHSFGTTSKEFLVSCSDVGGTKITLWRVSNPLAAEPSLRKKGVTVSSFRMPPDAQQKGSKIPLHTLDAGFRANLVFRDGYLFTVHTIAQDWGAGNVAALRIYQLGTDGRVLQEITYGSDRLSYFYPAIMPDTRGNLVLVFNRSGQSEFVGIHFTGRKANQPLGKLENSSALKVSTSSYLALDDSGRNRFGDYSGIALEQDDSIWIFGEFALDSGSWATQIGRVKY